MKRLALILCGLAAMLSMAAVPSAASPEVAPAVANCLGHTLVSANYVKSSSGLPWGAIQLCRNGSSFFALHVHYVSYPPPVHGPMPSGFEGKAILHSSTGEYWSCNVSPSVTACATPQIPILLGETFRAEGVVWRWTGTTWVIGADGWTLTCNTTTCWD
jgi:hypothetical protein